MRPLRSLLFAAFVALLGASSTGCATVAGVALGATLCGGSTRCADAAARTGAALDLDAADRALRAGDERSRRAPAAQTVYRCRHPERAGVSTVSRDEEAARRVCGGARCMCTPEAS